MAKYKIKYNYNTGNSFETQKGLEGILECSWASLEVCEKNLIRIKEHYDFYCLINYRRYNDFSSKEIKKKEKIAKNKDWYVAGYNFCLILKMDDGKDFQFMAPWCGYFESLNYVEIVEDNSSRKIIFN